MLRWMFTVLAFLACTITLPINIIETLRNDDGLPKNPLTMLTIQDVTGNLLFVHVGATYLFSAFYFLNALALALTSKLQLS